MNIQTYIPDNTLNALKRRAWIIESKSSKNVAYGFDDKEFKRMLKDTMSLYPLIHNSKWTMEVDRKAFVIKFAERLKSGQFGRVFFQKFLTRFGFRLFLSKFVISETPYSEIKKLSVNDRLAKFNYV